jgi:hypothetical protein
MGAVLSRVALQFLGNPLAIGTSDFICRAKFSGVGLFTGINPQVIEPNKTSLAQNNTFKNNL